MGCSVSIQGELSMAIIKYIGTTFFIVLVCGCSTGKTEDMLWHQPGKSYVDVKKSLLECGFSDFFTKMAPSIDYLAASVCVERLGYVREKSHVSGKNPVCANEWYKDKPSCQRDAVIPTPNVERRLNSEYCQSPYHYDSQECQP
jgi:hypothetical protein